MNDSNQVLNVGGVSKIKVHVYGFKATGTAVFVVVWQSSARVREVGL